MAAQVTELRRRASELAFLGKHRKAVRAYEQLLELSPSNAQVAFKIGELRRKLGDLEGAHTAYERAASLFRVSGLEGKAAAASRLVQEISTELGDRQPLPRWWRWLFRTA
jgi:tetratricopeptide (TPR) repeat protein